MVETLYKLTGRYLLAAHHEVVVKQFPKVQLGVGQAGGSEVAIHTIRAALQESGELKIILSDDLPNAYNERMRARMLRILYNKPELAMFFSFAAMAYGEPSELLLKGDLGAIVDSILSANGVKQGDPFALFMFALSVQACFEEADQEGVTAVAISDDLELVGEPERVFAAYDKVVAMEGQEEIRRDSDKRFVLWIHNAPPPLSLIQGCAQRGLLLKAGQEQDDGSWKGGIATILGAPYPTRTTSKNG